MDRIARALVVEDNPAWQDILAELLADLGLSVDVAVDAATAVSALAHAPHRVAVVDLSLGPDDEGNMDGLKVLEAVRKQDPGCSALLLTGFATVELAVSALTEYGAYTCLRKETFRRAEFREVVGRILAAPPVPHSTHAATSAAQSDGVATASGTRVGRALLVEDDSGWRSILAELLGEIGFSARVCTSFGEALGRIRRERYDLAVVDLSLASSTLRDNRDGFRVLREARAEGVPAVVVSGLATPSDAERLYGEYAVFAVLEKQQFDRASFRAVAREAASAGESLPGEIGALTRREREVMELVVRGLTNKGIAREMIVSENTVKRYLKTIFVKLGVDSRAAAVAKAVQAGLGR